MESQVNAIDREKIFSSATFVSLVCELTFSSIMPRRKVTEVLLLVRTRAEVTYLFHLKLELIDISYGFFF